jgi:hypothetical protein
MKNILLTLISILGFSSSVSAQIPSYIPKDSLVGWWPFNGNTNDESGNKFHGSNYGCSFVTDRLGKNSSALSLNGTSNYVNLGDSSRFNPVKNFTISVWLKTNNTKGNMAAYGKWGNNTNPNGEQFILYFDWSSVNGAVRTSNNWVPGKYASYSFNYADNAWHHYVMVYDGSFTSVFIDGKLKVKKIETGNVRNTKNDFIIGGYSLNFLTNYTNLWNGELDDFSFWRRNLDSAEINDLYVGCKKDEILTEPTSLIKKSGSNAKFDVVVKSGSMVNWQSDALNLGWVNVPSNSYYSGNQSTTLTVNSLAVNNHNQKFRVMAINGPCRDTSKVVTLKISDTCINVFNDTIKTTLYDTIAVQDTLIINAKLTGTTPLRTNLIKVFPNPANDYLVIDFGNYSSMSGYEINILNATGKSVYNSLINKSSVKIDLNSWTGKGVYFIRIFDTQGSRIENRKIVIQ